MADYKKMYYCLFSEVSKTIEQLQRALQKAEEIYINSNDIPLEMLNDNEPIIYKARQHSKHGR